VRLIKQGVFLRPIAAPHVALPACN